MQKKKEDKIKKNKQNPVLVFSRLLLLFLPHCHWLGLGIFLSLLTVLANVSLMAISGWFLASMAVAGLSGALLDYFTPAAGIRGCAIGRAGSRYLERLVSHDATLRVLAGLRHWFYTHLEPLAPAVLQKYHSGDLLSRIRADIDTLEHSYLRIISPMVTGLLASGLFVYFMSMYSRELALIEFVGLLAGGLLLPLFILYQTNKNSSKLVEESSLLRQHIMDDVLGLAELQVYGAGVKQSRKIRQASQNLEKTKEGISFFGAMSQGAIILLSGASLCGVILIVVPMIREETIAPVNLAMLSLFVLASFEAVTALPTAMQKLPETIRAADRVFNLVDAKPQVAEPGEPSPTPNNFDIDFKDVSFTYPNENNKVLAGFSFSLKSGEKLAIIGRSGRGKSTIISLLLRFWQADKGTIIFGGHPIEQYKGEDIRSYFAVAPQQGHFFATTIRENLLIAKSDASDEQLDEVCRIAMIDEFIASLEKGYDTWVGEGGVNLSGGQLKRLSIARTLLKSAPVLILDEPGEGLDRATEQQMVQNIFKQRRDSSIILITHRQVAGIKVLEI